MEATGRPLWSRAPATAEDLDPIHAGPVAAPMPLKATTRPPPVAAPV